MSQAENDAPKAGAVIIWAERNGLRNSKEKTFCAATHDEALDLARKWLEDIFQRGGFTLLNALYSETNQRARARRFMFAGYDNATKAFVWRRM